MPNEGFHLPGFGRPLASPESYVTGVLRNFREASQALGAAPDRLVLRLAASKNGAEPDYQIQTVDGEDAAAFSGATHAFLHKDISTHLDEGNLQDERYPQSEVESWLNAINGEGRPGGEMAPGLSAGWTEGDSSDPRD